MTETRTDTATQLVEAAARAQFKASHPRDSWDDDLGMEEQAIAKHLMAAVLAAVLPLLATAAEDRDEYLPTDPNVTDWLRDLAEQVSR